MDMSQMVGDRSSIPNSTRILQNRLLRVVKVILSSNNNYFRGWIFTTNYNCPQWVSGTRRQRKVLFLILFNWSAFVHSNFLFYSVYSRGNYSNEFVCDYCDFTDVCYQWDVLRRFIDWQLFCEMFSGCTI